MGMLYGPFSKVIGGGISSRLLAFQPSSAVLFRLRKGCGFRASHDLCQGVFSGAYTTYAGK